MELVKERDVTKGNMKNEFQKLEIDGSCINDDLLTDDTFVDEEQEKRIVK